VVNISQTPGVVILEYEVQGNAVGSGKLYENRFISVTIEDRKIVGWHSSAARPAPNCAVRPSRRTTRRCSSPCNIRATTDSNGRHSHARRPTRIPRRAGLTLSRGCRHGHRCSPSPNAAAARSAPEEKTRGPLAAGRDRPTYGNLAPPIGGSPVGLSGPLMTGACGGGGSGAGIRFCNAGIRERPADPRAKPGPVPCVMPEAAPRAKPGVEIPTTQAIANTAAKRRFMVEFLICFSPSLVSHVDSGRRIK
jgi:hypothetical protein